MANQKHVEWLLEGVDAWNRRREKELFVPDLQGARIYWEFRAAHKLDQHGRIPLAGVDFGNPFHDIPHEWFYDEAVEPRDQPFDVLGISVYSTEPLDDPDEPDESSFTAKLAGVNLNCADLTGANLTDADLIGAQLAYSNLAGANLDGADLTDANLHRANLVKAHLWGANLIKARLVEVDFTDAILAYANVTGAKLEGADFSGSNLAHTELWKAVLYSDNNISPKQHPVK